MWDSGDGTLIITRSNKKILVDAGGEEQDGGYSIGENILLPYLLDRGVLSLDYIVLSHMDSDHCLRSTLCNGKYKSEKYNNFKTRRI